MSSKRKSKSFSSDADIGNDGFLLKVVMLDGSYVDVDVPRNTYGQTLFDTICNSVGLTEREYFGLVYGLSEDSTRHWLDLEKPIRKYVKEPWILSCEVKFYPKDPTVIQDELALKYIYIQVKKDLQLSRLKASFSSYAFLGSLMLQHEFGDVQYVNHLQYAPSDYSLTDYLYKEVARLHRHHKKLSKKEAQLLYLENAKKLQMYGVHLRPAKNQFGEEVQIGVCASGVLVLKDTQDIEHRFPWPKIKKVCYEFSNFYMKIGTSPRQERKIYCFTFHSINSAKKFFHNCREHHLFFRCSMQSNDNIFNTTYDQMQTEPDGLNHAEEHVDVANLLDLSEYGSLNTTHSQPGIRRDYERTNEEYDDTDESEETVVNSEHTSSALGEAEASEFEYTHGSSRDFSTRNYNSLKSDKVLYEEPYSIGYTEPSEYENNSLGRYTVDTAFSEDQIDSAPIYSTPLKKERQTEDEFPPPPSPVMSDDGYSYSTVQENVNQSVEDLQTENEFVTALNSPEDEYPEEEWPTASEEMGRGTSPNGNNGGNHDVDLDNAILDAVGFDTDKTVDRNYKNRYSFRMKMQESAV